MKSNFSLKSFAVGPGVGFDLLIAATGGAIVDRLIGIKSLDPLFPRESKTSLEQKVVNEERVVTDVAEKGSPSAVTVSIQTPQRRVLEFNPFGGFRSSIQGGTPQDIGTGFIVSGDGLIVTNKHVVSVEGATYKVITQDGKEYEAKSISRDPANDIAVVKIDPSTGSGQALTPVELGDSGNLKVGQFVVAIGTALGEFRHTVTTGVISGLGRGITAGNPLEGFVEKLDDIIQTDAAINPGNSGGPLLNSLGQVIGVNLAVAQGAENIGFAIPINIIKEALNQFKETGKFASKPFLGVQYQMISMQTAILNNVPQGAFVTEVVEDSPAKLGGIQVEDIIIKFDETEVKDEKGGLADIISKKKPGDNVEVEIWRNSETTKLSITLSEFSE